MSSLVRVFAVKAKKFAQLPVSYQLRLISTSKKNRETTSVISPVTTDETVCKTNTKSKNWVSYGFSVTDEYEDKFYMHAITFLGVSVIFVFGGFLLAYRPADLGRDWAQREGYLELRRREQLGLPLIDPNYLPLEQILPVLPSDEELGDTEIII